MFNLAIKRDANAGAQFVELREIPHLCGSFAHFWALPQNADRPSELRGHDLPSISVQAGFSGKSCCPSSPRHWQKRAPDIR